MKKRFITLFVSFLFFSGVSFSQTPAYHWWDPAKNNFSTVAGQGWHDGLANFYDRLPAKAEKSVRKVVWHLSRESAGLMIRFRSNAPDIRVRYTVGGKIDKPHMPATGVSGVDLYALDKDGGWEWSGGSYHFGDTIEYHFKALKHDYVREYHLYLPLYNNVKWLEIGVQDSTTFTPLPLRKDKPIVIYGTSIAQGACASRPGLAWTAILGRKLHDPVINLGFSGNGQLEEPVVQLLTELDPKLYVLDCLPNMWYNTIPPDTARQRLITTVKTLKRAHPDVPVLLVDDADVSIDPLDTSRDAPYRKINEINRAVFEELKISDMQGIYLLPASQIGLNTESTTEGVHPNDYGMLQYATAYENIIREILHEPVGPYTTTQPCMQYRSKVYDWEARHREELKLNQTNPPKIVFLGNSITHYWGGEPVSTVHRGDDSWDKYFKPAGVRNFGFSWDRIENVLWRVYHGELDGYKAKQVLINIGTNNLAFNSDKEIIAGLKLLVNAVKQRQPQAKILMIGIYPRKGGEERVKLLNEQIVRLCGDENIHYADPGIGLLDTSGKVVESLFQDGRLHPNAAGYRILAKALQPYLVK